MPAHLKVKRSKIPGLPPGMDRGMFARERIEVLDTIGRYRGRLITAEAADRLPAWKKPYLLKKMDGMVIDGSGMTNSMRWANHSSTEPNAEFVEEKDKVIVVAMRDIEAGEEILVQYSDSYDPEKPDRSLISSYLVKKEAHKLKKELLSYCCINCRFAGAHICGTPCYKKLP